MFFSRFFTKDAGQLLAKADKRFKCEQYAEARQLYFDAMEKIGSGAEQAQDRLHIEQQLSRTANILAGLNIDEAEAAFRSGNLTKGTEYLQLSLELADDVSLREKAENLLKSVANINQHSPAHGKAQAKHDCAGCASPSKADAELHDPTAEHLTAAERFQLLANTLPGDLPQRYCQLGEKFASAYLLAHSDEAGEALVMLKELLTREENDILLYESALLHFRGGDAASCEKLLKRALQINGANPLCHLGLAQLYIDSQRYDEAIGVLGTMLELEILSDNALIMLGDVHTLRGDYDRAIEVFTGTLTSPALKKASAERLVQILATQGREDEAAYVAKTYLKGCC